MQTKVWLFVTQPIFKFGRRLTLEWSPMGLKSSKMERYPNLITEILKEATSRLGLKNIDETRRYFKTQTYGYGGDFSITLALRDSKLNKIPIEKAAGDIKAKLEGSKFIKRTEVVNGYVNCWYDYTKLAEYLMGGINDDYGKSDYGKDERVMVEHTSVNPNKAIHIGHVRNSSIGDSLSRLLRFAGYDLTVTNYIDDTGAQVADNVVGVKFLNLPRKKPGVKIDHYLGDEVYVKVNKLYEDDPALMEKRGLVLKAIEEGNNEIALLAKDMVMDVLKAQLQTLSRLGVFFDLVNYESHILMYKFWATAFAHMKSVGAIKLETDGKKKGCWVFKTAPPDEDKILVRSDGTVVYAGKDIAYAMWKHGLLDSDFRYKKMELQKNGEELWTTTLDKDSTKTHPTFNHVKHSISVIDIRQSYEQAVVKEAIEKLGNGKGIDYVHYEYGVVALSPNTANKLGVKETEEGGAFQMSGRKGVYINADNFLDKLYETLLDETKSKNQNLGETECKEVAESLAVSTLRYEMIRTDPKKIIVFDLDEALKLESKGAVYIDYTLSRMAGILRNSNSKIKTSMAIPELSDFEKRVLLDILRFPEIIESAAKALDLTVVSGFLSEFASDFNAFYTNTTVLKAEESIRDFRLWLVTAARTTLINAMSTLGLVPLERM